MESKKKENENQLKRKKSSGAQFRNQRKKRKFEDLKLSGSMSNFLNKSTNSENLTPVVEVEQITTISDVQINNASDKYSEVLITSVEKICENDKNEKVVQTMNVIPDDPGLWPETITTTIANILVTRGPVQLSNFIFPTNKNGRSFSEIYYVRKLPNKQSVMRDWLLYSISKDAVFCYCCKIFGNRDISFNDGYSDWQHLSSALKRHETSRNHIENIKTWIDLNSMLKNNKTVNKVQLRILESEKKFWCEVIERIIAVVKFLSRQCLGFRGSSKTLYQHDNGNFLKAIEMIASFDSIMREHIRKIEDFKLKNKSGRIVHYLGETIQNEIINLLGTTIKNNILNKIRESKYYSIILDCTPDVSHTEQISIIIRYVYLNNSSKNVEICENFLSFYPITDTTGEGLCQFLLNFLTKLNIDIKNMRGQGYDNGSNMRGKNKGLQKKILDINNRAFYVPCSAHSLNLVVNDASNITHETVNFFNIVQEIYNFFSASTKRWSIISKHVPNLKLKPLSATRWSSRIDALKPLRYHLEKIFDALIEISEDSTKFDCATTHKANSLALNIQNYKFICSIIVWFDILNQINCLSKMMQNPTINIKVCMNLLENLIKFVKEYRSDVSFDKLLDEASIIAKELNVEPNFPSDKTVRPRRKKTTFEYEQRDEVLIDPKQNFKVNFFLCIIDQTLSSLDRRFDELNNYVGVFGFLAENLFDYSDDELKEHCHNLQIKLTNHSEDESDIDGDDLYREIINLKLHFSEISDKTAKGILQYMFTNNLCSTFPFTVIALRILLTLPVTVASGERSFSKLKIIKNYLRSTMIQQRLNDLSIVAIEHEILDHLNIEEMITEFAHMKVRKMQFL